ncbi:MAG: LON peptidase substrate-binding domain-containing protein [Dysosmobacter sp.]
MPEEKDLYAVGTVSHISQILRLSATSVRCVVEGRRRARLRRLWQTEPYLQANVEALGGGARPRLSARAPGRRPCCARPTILFSEYAELAGSVSRRCSPR